MELAAKAFRVSGGPNVGLGDATGSDVLDEIVTLRSRDVEVGPAFAGSFELTLHDAPDEELSSLTPAEPIAGYWRQVGATFVGGEHLG